MRRSLVALLVLGAAAAGGAGVYTVYATDREYSRLIAAGDEAVSADQPFRALETYSGAIALRPNSMLAHLKRGMVYRDRGELDSAIKDLRRASQLDPTATRPLELLGDSHLAQERFDRARERYARYLELDDRSARVWYKLGLAQYRDGKVADAADALRRAVALDRGLAEGHLLLGLCLRDQDQSRPAREALETAAMLAPALTAPREALAALYASLGDRARRIDQLEALAALDPARPDRLVALGLAYADARRLDTAVIVLSRAVERFPDEPGVYAALGRVWLEAAEARDDAIALKKAVTALSMAAGQSDVPSETLTDLGRAWRLSGDPEAAERALRQAVSRLPVRPEAYLELATLAARANRIQDARDALVRYATLVGDTQPLASIAGQIATYSIRLGDASLALRWIDRAVDEAGTTPALVALKRRAEALEATAKNSAQQ